MGSLALPHWPWTAPGVHPVPQEPVLVLAVQRCRRHRVGNGAGLQGLDDVHRMGFVKGLHNLDAKAVVSAEEHRVVNGASSSAPLFGSHGPPGRQYLGSDWLRVHSAGGGLLR